MIKPSLRIDPLSITFYLDNQFLTEKKKFSYLSSDAVAGTNIIQLQSTRGFVGGSFIVCLGEIGNEKTEILKIKDASAGSAKLNANTQFDHPQDTKVFILDWDEVEFSNAPTISGTKSTVSASYSSLQVDYPETIYRDESFSSGYGFVRVKISGTGTYSVYSDSVPYTGYEDSSVFKIKKRALDSVGEEISNLITHDYLNESLREARREYHQSPGKRPFRQKSNVDIGNVTVGQYKIKLPSDVEKPYTAENIYAVRIGTEKPMEYYDKKEWDEDYRGVAHSTLLEALDVTDSFISVANSRDFEPTGNVRIEGDEIQYTARNVNTGSLTIANALSTGYAVGTDVWQNSSEGNPQNFTVFIDADGSPYIAFSQPLDTTLAKQNIYSDYYVTLPTADSDADLLDEPDLAQDSYVRYLAYKIKKKKDKGLLPREDSDFLEWERIKNLSLNNEYVGKTVRLIPDIN